MTARRFETRWAKCLSLAGLAAAWAACPPPALGGTPCKDALHTAAEIQAAMKDATPGTVICLAPGTYVGERSTSGDPGSKALFYSGRSGTSSSPIVLRSADPDHPAVLTGTSVSDGSYGLRLTGDYWQIEDVVVTHAQKGIIIDNGNHNLLCVTVHHVGDEGVHFRDGSSYNVLERSRVYDTGNYQPGYGEGAYVGSDSKASYEHRVIGNIIRDTRFGGDITAEHIDIKEGADGTVVEFCTFDGPGITGQNSADSFVDVKGLNSVIRYNRGYRRGNSFIVDAFQVSCHGTSYPTGKNNTFYWNTIDLDSTPGYLVHATSASSGTRGHDDVRTGGGNVYNRYVNVGTATPVAISDPSALELPLAVTVAPNPSDGEVGFSCAIDQSGDGSLSVFDVAGRRVAQIANGPFTAGRTVFHWDGRTPGGERAGRGIYFVRMKLSRREVVQEFAIVR